MTNHDIDVKLDLLNELIDVSNHSFDLSAMRTAMLDMRRRLEQRKEEEIEQDEEKE